MSESGFWMNRKFDWKKCSWSFTKSQPQVLSHFFNEFVVGLRNPSRQQWTTMTVKPHYQLLTLIQPSPYTCVTHGAHAAPVWLHPTHTHQTLQQVILLYAWNKCATMRLNEVATHWIKEPEQGCADWGNNSVVSLGGLQKKMKWPFSSRGNWRNQTLPGFKVETEETSSLICRYMRHHRGGTKTQSLNIRLYAITTSV